MEKLYSHCVPIPLNQGDGLVFKFTCAEAFIVVAAQQHGRLQFSGDGQAPAVLTPHTWETVLALDTSQAADTSRFVEGDLSLGRLASPRGIAWGGFDGVCYAQLAAPGSFLVLRVANGVTQGCICLYVLTSSSTSPKCEIQDLSTLF